MVRVWYNTLAPSRAKARSSSRTADTLARKRDGSISGERKLLYARGQSSGAALLLVEVHRGGSGVGWATGERGAAMGPLKHKGTRLGMVVVGCLQVRTPAPPAHTTAACIARARSAMSASGGLSGDTSVTPSFLKFGGMHRGRTTPVAMPWRADGTFDPGTPGIFSSKLGHPTTTPSVFSHTDIVLY